MLGSVLFNVFINDLGDGVQYTLNKFTDDTKLWGVMDKSKSSAAIQVDLNRLEKQAFKNKIKKKKK